MAVDWAEDRVATISKEKKHGTERSANFSRHLEADTKVISTPRERCLKGRNELRLYKPLVEIIVRSGRS
jgi:hypothetical protein